MAAKFNLVGEEVPEDLQSVNQNYEPLNKSLNKSPNKTPSKFKQSESKVKTETTAKIEVLEVAHRTEFSLDAAKEQLARNKKTVKQVETASK